MATLIDGTDGLIQIGPTNHLTTVGYVTKWKASLSTEMNTKGPYVGDATLRKTRKAKTSSGSLEFDIPKGADVGQTKMIALHEAGTDFRLMLRAGCAAASPSVAYAYIAANAGLSGIDIEGDAESGYSGTANFEDMDGYTYGPTA